MSTHQLPAEFITFWQSLVESFQRRSTRATHRELVRRWYAGVAIPGYPRHSPNASLPSGWSYCNLLRHLPSKAQFILRRHGRN